ncbi:MAG: DinB family protein [Bacteroidota bacterium]
MKFSIEEALHFLERTPATIDSILRGLPDPWLKQNEGPDTWSAYDIVGHLIHGEKTDWIPRMRIILSERTEKTFEPFDRFAQLKAPKDRPMEDLLEEFRMLRQQNVEILSQQSPTEQSLERQGIHPDLGIVTLKELLTTWVVHDWGHIAQISRVLAKQYKDGVGPWFQYLKILQD